MTMTAEQKAARLEMIKAAAEKYNKRAEFKRKQAINAAKVRRWTEIEETPKRRKAAEKFDAEMARMDENHNHYTDASKYASQYYGEVAYETTKFDNDWD